jgi:HlyD family secretion protein
VITVSDRQRYWVRAYLPESALQLGRLNTPVQLAIDGFPDRVFTGRVAFVAQQPEFTPNNVQTPETRGQQVYRIRVEVTTDTERLRPGMAADLAFGEHEDD